MSEPSCMSLKEAVQQVGSLTSGSKFLALGQTVFWDEPMKAGLALEAQRAGVGFVAGVHDTDYFAKVSGVKGSRAKFKTLPHNDGSTRNLWSAAAEFSALFGSETVVTREELIRAGLRFDRLSETRPDFLDEATEAWGWRGIVSTDENPPITLEVPGDDLARELCNTLRWAIDESVGSIGESNRSRAQEVGDKINEAFCLYAEAPHRNLAAIYRDLLNPIYSLVAGEPLEFETTQTSELLRFNTQTYHLPRFEFFAKYVAHSTRAEACQAYNEATTSYPGLYDLTRFGSGAIPFDLVIPGLGRGTIRLGNRGAVITTRVPQFLSYKKPLETLAELAELIEKKFGPNCAVIGKAVTLIGMLGREFTFAFHEGASSYVRASRVLHNKLNFRVNPILRIRYQTWDSLASVENWFDLPKPFQAAFGSETICAPSFASRWRAVVGEQKSRIEQLGQIRKPGELLCYLDQKVGGAWSLQAQEYEAIHGQLSELSQEIESLKEKRRTLHNAWKADGQRWQEIQREMGDHFRAKIFEKIPDQSELDCRASFAAQLERLRKQREAYLHEIAMLGERERAASQSETFLKVHKRRREIEMESEFKRLSMIREATISSRGLESANRRPSAWWIPLVSPDGRWFRRIMETATCYWEPMI
ncbi:MAG: hypothetical protein JST51_08425 [Armatimonadetes bacterium]|nr:hypothetical protein [Armatimonadota bacterium]